MAEEKGKGKGGLEGILGGLTNVLEKLGELAEKGEELRRSGAGRSGRGGDVVYGVSVRAAGPGGGGARVEPFGNVKTDGRTGEPSFQDAREPILDLFEESDHWLIVAEMPGVEAEDVRLELSAGVLTLAAERGERKYRKELAAPGGLEPERATVSARNGIVEIRCPR